MPNVEFNECVKCKAIHLISQDHIPLTPYECENCKGTAFRPMGKKFLLHCPQCLEFWSKRVVRTVFKEGICRCLVKSCNSVLNIRKEWTSDIISDEIEESEESKDSTKISTSTNQNSSEVLKLPSTIDNNSGISANLKEDDNYIPLPDQNSSKNLKESHIEQQEKKDSDSAILKQDQNPSEQVIIQNKEESKKVDIIHQEISLDPIITKEKNIPSYPESEISQVQKIIEPSPPIDAEILPPTTFDIDISSIIVNLPEEKINQLFSILFTADPRRNPIFIEDIINLFSQMLIHLDSNSDRIIEEPIQFTYYIGDISGDFNQLKMLCQYFLPIIEKYPAIKIIFLGNYLGYNQHDIYMLALLCLFTLKYPENVVLLKGMNDFEEYLVEINVWKRIRSLPSSNVSIPQNEEKFARIYTLIMNMFKRLPLLHIGSMNKGEIAIVASHSGIPMNSDHGSKPVQITDTLTEFMKPCYRLDSIDDFSWSILRGVPDPNLTTYYDFGSDSEAPKFSQQAFFDFLTINNCHYFVRAHEEIGDGVKFYFEHDLCCTVFSTKEFNLPEKQIQKQFSPKIVRLVPASPPAIISTDEETLKKDLLETFGIS